MAELRRYTGEERVVENKEGNGQNNINANKALTC